MYIYYILKTKTQILAATVETRVYCTLLLTMECEFLAEIHIPEHHSIPPSKSEEEAQCHKVRKGLSVQHRRTRKPCNYSHSGPQSFCASGTLKTSFPVPTDPLRDCPCHDSKEPAAAQTD